jgi:hypothetical protein
VGSLGCHGRRRGDGGGSSDLAFTPAEAAVRADATFAIGVGILHLSASVPNTESAEKFLDIMLRH